jgi:hypothetical protein
VCGSVESDCSCSLDGNIWRYVAINGTGATMLGRKKRNRSSGSRMGKKGYGKMSKTKYDENWKFCKLASKVTQVIRKTHKERG